MKPSLNVVSLRDNEGKLCLFMRYKFWRCERKHVCELPTDTKIALSVFWHDIHELRLRKAAERTGSDVFKTLL